MKPYNWFETNPLNYQSSIFFQKKPIRKQNQRDIVKFTQSDFKTLAESNTKLVFVSFSPIERNWFKQSEVNFRLASFLFGLETKRLKQISRNQNYFAELSKEIAFFEQQSQKIFSVNGINYIVKLPTDAEQLNTNLTKNIINIIPTVEGIHSFYSTEPFEVTANIGKLYDNIHRVKNSLNKPFFVTLAHHFYNFLCGHCKSIFIENKLIDKILLKIVDQSQGENSNITPQGIDLINYLLEINQYNEKQNRILIDIKHLSIEARKQYYKIIWNHNNSNPNDKIPIIASHCAYSGCKTFEELGRTPEVHFNNSTINLCDIDVKQIYLSEGLIGIILDERILASKNFRQKVELLNNDQLLYSKKWAELIVYELLQMALSIKNDISIEDKSRIWEMFTIGSDFDGFTNPINTFTTAIQFLQLEEFLVLAFEESRLYRKYFAEISPYTIVRKIMFENAYNFTIKHYFYNLANNQLS